MYFKSLIVLCIGALVIQGHPQRRLLIGDDINHVIDLLEQLEKQLTDEVHNTVDNLKADLKSIEDLDTDILSELDEQLKSGAALMLTTISELEDRAQELGIDISDCVLKTPDEINDLTGELIGVTSECLEDFYTDAEKSTNEAISKINSTTAAIDDYWKKIEECSNKEWSDQDICIAELTTDISRDSVDIPDEVSLYSQEALEYLDNVKTDLLVCQSGKLDYLEELGNAIVSNVATCAEDKFNSVTTIPTTAAPTTISPTTAPPTLAPTTTAAPTEAPTTTPPQTTTAAPTEAPTTTAAPTEAPTTTAATTEAPATTTEPTPEPTTTAAPTEITTSLPDETTTTISQL